MIGKFSIVEHHLILDIRYYLFPIGIMAAVKSLKITYRVNILPIVRVGHGNLVFMICQ